ncbi:hypothetical protein KL86CLO1_10517 [uncultured Eubacteriales bacterium]|uniref:SPOR domain-containing protein n=1 Tax=uncultured Eubacteriales bacterium TaxID=172733 RepID=A0A212J513_9FIRM|nr:hypothetical protein KL86CLO1_10517 [uncultured Eubacteriales bacterium]
MSKHIEKIPLSRIVRIQIWPNPNRLTLAEAMAAQAEPPDIALSGVYYNGDWTIAGHVKADGQILSREEGWGEWGYAWDNGPDIKMIQIPKGGGAPYLNYLSCKSLLTPWDGIDAPLTVGTALQGKRGWAALALDGDNLIVWAAGDGANAITLPQLRSELYELGAETALALDGGQSVKYRAKDGSVYINNASRPVTQHYIFIWLKPIPTKTQYKVQVGAFSVKSNAERLRDELAGKGYPGFITEVQT